MNIKMHTMNERQTEERKKESERTGQRPNKVSGHLCARLERIPHDTHYQMSLWRTNRTVSSFLRTKYSECEVSKLKCHIFFHLRIKCF